MYTLTVEDCFSSAHQLRGYRGKCENLHGHNWRVVLSVQGNTLDETGMLIDFHVLRNMLKTTVDYLDHKNINDLSPFDTINPSSENLALYISNSISEELKKEHSGISVESVTVWESDTSRCTYSP